MCHFTITPVIIESWNSFFFSLITWIKFVANHNLVNVCAVCARCNWRECAHKSIFFVIRTSTFQMCCYNLHNNQKKYFLVVSTWFNTSYSIGSRVESKWKCNTTVNDNHFGDDNHGYRVYVNFLVQSTTVECVCMYVCVARCVGHVIFGFISIKSIFLLPKIPRLCVERGKNSIDEVFFMEKFHLDDGSAGKIEIPLKIDFKRQRIKRANSLKCPSPGRLIPINRVPCEQIVKL